MDMIKPEYLKKIIKSGKTERALAGLLMDIVYFGTGYLIYQGVSLIPVRVNAAFLLMLVYLFHYLYRYVAVREIGECGKPLHEQLGVKLHWVILNILDFIFVLTMPAFPSFIIIFSAIELFGVSSFRKYPQLIIITFFIMLPLSMFSWIIYSNQREGVEPRNMERYPELSSGSKKKLTLFIIPMLAMFTGASLSIFSHSFFSRMSDPSAFFYSPDIQPFIFMSFLVFVPFRYLIMRTAGFSVISAASFLISIVLIVVSFMV